MASEFEPWEIVIKKDGERFALYKNTTRVDSYARLSNAKKAAKRLFPHFRAKLVLYDGGRNK